MQGIEPHVGALLWFALFWSTVSIGFYVLSGSFPIETRPDLRARPLGLLLVAANVAMLLILAGGSLAYGITHLRWTSLVVVVGLGVLFAPGVFNVWPERWRDGIAGLTIVLVCFSLTLTLLGAAGNVIKL